MNRWHRLMIALYRIAPRSLSKWVVFWLKPKYVIAVVALVADDAGRLLVLRHTYGKPYFWRFPGGIKERGEHPFATAERELREEANVAVKATRVISVIETVSTFDIVVYCEIVNEQPFHPNAEVEEKMWIHPQNPEVALPPDQQEIMILLKEMPN